MISDTFVILYLVGAVVVFAKGLEIEGDGEDIVQMPGVTFTAILATSTLWPLVAVVLSFNRLLKHLDK